MKVQQHQPDERQSAGKEQSDLRVERVSADAGESLGPSFQSTRIRRGNIVATRTFDQGDHVVVAQAADEEENAERH